MKTSYTRQELCDCVSVLNNYFERVELVDAPSCHKLDPATLEPVSGCTFSKEGNRCDFCVSAQCIAEKNHRSRLRIAGDRVYNTTCQYVNVDGRDLALLMANDATEDFCAGADGENVDAAMFADVSRMVERCNSWIYRDYITGVYNRRFLEQNYLPALTGLMQDGKEVTLAMVRINKLNTIHDQFGREATDRLVGYVANLFLQQIDPVERDGIVCRMSNSCLVVSCEGHDRGYFEDKLRALYEGCHKEFRATMSRFAPFTLTFVTAGSAEAEDGTAMLNLLDKRMGAAHTEEKTGLVQA